MIQIYHNPRCGKSRNCLAFLEKSGLQFEIINYFIDKPSFEELSIIINKLQINAIDLVRKKEKVWIKNYKVKTMNEREIIKAMTDYPLLIERPIVVKKNKAIIARELDKIEAFVTE